MDAGSRSTALSGTAFWRRLLAAWMLMMLAETVSGIVREVFIAPAVGALTARQIGVGIGSAIILGIAWLTARWRNAVTRHTQIVTGVSWVVLTVSFEVALGRALGLSVERIYADYDLSRGGLMLLGLLVMLLAPMLTATRR